MGFMTVNLIRKLCYYNKKSKIEFLLKTKINKYNMEQVNTIYIGYYFIVKPLQPAVEILIAELGYAGFESFVETEKGVSAYIQKEEWNADILNDITHGWNNCTAIRTVCCPMGFTSASGWDPLVGLGSPSYIRLMKESGGI